MNLKKFLLLADKQGRNLDDPQNTIRVARIIRSKFFLSHFYTDCYLWMKKEIGDTHKKYIVELGSGGGFMKEIIPNVITSDILELPFIDRHFSALSMPFRTSTVNVFVMMNVLHHLKDVKKFFREVTRTLKPGGKLLAIEPANTLWGRFVYQHFHHEVFDLDATWRIAGKGPLSHANGALPWIVLVRDKEKFDRLFPQLRLNTIIPHNPLRYLLSGGLTYKQLMPDWSYSAITALEWILTPANPLLGMFYKIEITKQI